MTAVQEQMGQRTLNEPVEIRFTLQGLPLAVRWQGRLWPVGAEPLHWFSRCNWREANMPAGRGQGNIVDVEFWRLQVRATSTSPLRTLEVRKHPGWDGISCTSRRRVDMRPFKKRQIFTYVKIIWLVAPLAPRDPLRCQRIRVSPARSSAAQWKCTKNALKTR